MIDHAQVPLFLRITLKLNRKQKDKGAKDWEDDEVVVVKVQGRGEEEDNCVQLQRCLSSHAKSPVQVTGEKSPGIEPALG